MEFKKYGKIKAVGHDDNKELLLNLDDEVVIEEKMDGGNFRFYIKDSNIFFGSRTRDLDNDNPNTKAFNRCIEFVKERLQDKDLKLLEGRIYYGECMISHTMQYDWEKIPPFLGFDIYDIEKKKYLARKEDLFIGMGLPVVPLIDKMDVKSFLIDPLTDDIVPKSVYASPSTAADNPNAGIDIRHSCQNKGTLGLRGRGRPVALPSSAHGQNVF